MSNEITPTWFPHFTSCGKCDHFGFTFEHGFTKKCKCKLEYDAQVSLIKGLYYSNIINFHSSNDVVTLITNMSFDSYKGPDNNKNIPKLKMYTENFIKKYTGTNLFLSGKPGTQKTTLAKVIIKELVKQKINCYYILANDLIQLIIDSARNDEKKDLLAELMIKDLLIVDEFDENKVITYASGWQRKNLFPWIKTRLEIIHKATVFISNQTIDNIGLYFEEAIQDLILREVVDHNMIFEDKYYVYKEKLDISSIWE